MSEAKAREDDGFNVVNEVSPAEWVEIETDNIGEYVHLVYDEEKRELRCYLSVEPDANSSEVNARVKTTIEDVKLHKTTSDRREVDIKHFYLTWTEAMDFMNFVELMVITGDDSTLVMKWSESDGGPMMENGPTSMEAITFVYDTLDGRKRMSEIRSEWQSPTHRMANIEGEGF